MLNKLQFQNLAELQLQNLDQPLCSKSEKSLVLGPNVSSQICNKLLPTWSSLSTSATVTISTSFELASSQARVTSIKFTKQEWVSQSVRESVTDKHCQWSDSGPTKRSYKVWNTFYYTLSWWKTHPWGYIWRTPYHRDTTSSWKKSSLWRDLDIFLGYKYGTKII